MLHFLCCFFSVFFFLNSLNANSWLFFWLNSEMGYLSLVPLFFSVVLSLNAHKAISYFILISIFSSNIFMISGLFPQLQDLLLFYFFFKFGCLPFSFWLFSLFNNISWLVIFFFSTIAKISLLYISNLSFSHYDFLVYLYIPLNLVCFCFFLVCWVYSLRGFFCIINISSSCILVCLILFQGFNSLLVYYIPFLLFSSLLVFLFYNDFYLNNWHGFLLYLLFGLCLPCSLGIFYKFFSLSVFYLCGFWVTLFCWFIYSAVEQIYFGKLLIFYYSRGFGFIEI
uniref:NADH dehydrogenase subunit 2 n=1 Tax=Tetraonchus monenteron TaxID=198446 RepID=UPI001436AE51|nr:NADH dehydrogenase subunit 2 [Tetraonchus monenteron]QIH29913.1 NADH dehydrogenase subunit 2 [Tetraonchus monenteron]